MEQQKYFYLGWIFVEKQNVGSLKKEKEEKKKVQADSMCNEIDMYFHSCKQQMAPSLNPHDAG